MRKGRKRSAAIPAASLWKLTGFTSICPTIVYWRADDADEGKIGYGEAVCRLADHWYAALITR